MTSISIVGDPDKICSSLDVIIAAGNNILSVTKTKNNATYLIVYEGAGPFLDSFLLLESGSYMLLETGDKIVLE